MNRVRAAGAPIRPHSEGGAMWIVMVSSKGGYVAHSPHVSEEKANEWARCLEYGGADVSVCSVPPDVCRDIVTILEGEKS